MRPFNLRKAGMVCLTLLAMQSGFSANLYQGDSYAPLTSDRRASKVGDIVTVLIYEDSTASNSADTSTHADFGVHADLSTSRGFTNGAKLGMGDDYGGRGRIQRAGRLVAQLSVPIQEMMPNGDLLVAGEQAIDVNGEKTNIRLKGRVRQEDIMTNNTVLSSRLADVHIDYVGDGYLTDRSKPGLIPRIFAWLGLW
ncbi:flagellar basal body L-ring protein FlgH [Paraherbaspirillum soli]|uniref:Flagellar basal body L-ring protein FlgH n=1 Tax=Paraherbaspirillum soli TaxID=631222 RepID=A0ABW0MES4_9BURK